MVQLDGPVCGCGDRGCVEALCLAAVDRGDVGEAARVLGTGAANLVGLLDIDRVLVGGRTVEGAPGVFLSGVRGCLRRGRGGRGRSVWGWGWCRGRSGLRKARRSWCWHRCSGRTVSCAGVG